MASTSLAFSSLSATGGFGYLLYDRVLADFLESAQRVANGGSAYPRVSAA